MSSNTDSTGFGKFVPGFEFLQNLAKGPEPSSPAMARWIAPTLDVQTLDKRIDELKAVQYWLDQNAAALKATIQALEVQKMTLATLKNMNSAVPGSSPAAATLPDPMAFWGALTQQFQQIAADAMKDVADRAAAAPAGAVAKGKGAGPTTARTQAASARAKLAARKRPGKATAPGR